MESTATATPEEAALASSLRLELNAWHKRLPAAHVMVQPYMTWKHIQMLIQALLMEQQHDQSDGSMSQYGRQELLASLAISKTDAVSGASQHVVGTDNSTSAITTSDPCCSVQASQWLTDGTPDLSLFSHSAPDDAKHKKAAKHAPDHSLSASALLLHYGIVARHLEVPYMPSPASKTGLTPSCQGSVLHGSTSEQQGGHGSNSHTASNSSYIAERLVSDASFARLIVVYSQSAGHLAMLNAVAETAAGEHALIAQLSALQQQSISLRLSLSDIRISGCFLLTNLPQLSAAVRACGEQLEVLSCSPYLAGARHVWILVEQLQGRLHDNLQVCYIVHLLTHYVIGCEYCIACKCNTTLLNVHHYARVAEEAMHEPVQPIVPAANRICFDNVVFPLQACSTCQACFLELHSLLNQPSLVQYLQPAVLSDFKAACQVWGMAVLAVRGSSGTSLVSAAAVLASTAREAKLMFAKVRAHSTWFWEHKLSGTVSKPPDAICGSQSCLLLS